MKVDTDQINQANDRLTYMSPEIRCLEKIHAKGYTDQFSTNGQTLLCLQNNHQYGPQDITIVNFYRFEGISDPDDMSIIYVIQTKDGHRGTMVDAYGVYADEAVCKFISDVHEFHKQTDRGWN